MNPPSGLLRFGPSEVCSPAGGGSARHHEDLVHRGVSKASDWVRDFGVNEKR